MAVKTTKVKYEASDGKEFDDSRDAKLHDDLILARDRYDTVRREFNRAIVQTQKTADGVAFDTGAFRDYYYITPGWSGMPDIQEVHFIGWNYEISEYEDKVEIVRAREDRKGYDHYPIHNLYHDRRKADEALVVARETWLSERAQEVAEFRAKIFPKG